jgi:hypothetical protein
MQLQAHGLRRFAPRLSCNPLSVIPFEYGVRCRFESVRRKLLYRMSQQPELISPPLAPSPAPDPGFPSSSSPTAQNGGHGPQRIPRWLVRAELFLRIMLRIYIGLAVCYAPWSPLFWDQNPIFVQFPTLSIYAAHGAVRGLISGLGLLNLWIAVRDAMQSRSR